MIDIAQALTELTALPIHDRLRVVESLWDSIPPDSPRPAEPCVAATSGSGGPQHPQNQRNLSMTGTIYAVSAIASSLPSTP